MSNIANVKLIETLKEQSTWRLLGLGIITYGVYFAYYIKNQSKKINDTLETDAKISSGFTEVIMALSYLSLFSLIAYSFTDFGQRIEVISDIFDGVLNIMIMVWGFKARNRVNHHCELNSESNQWFHGFWTFIFSPFYFNYKVNEIIKSEASKGYAE